MGLDDYGPIIRFNNTKRNLVIRAFAQRDIFLFIYQRIVKDKQFIDLFALRYKNNFPFLYIQRKSVK